jgi:hypothetical protein
MKRLLVMVTLSGAALVLSSTALAQHNNTVSPYRIKVPKYSHTTIKVSKISHPIKVVRPSKYRPLVPRRAAK